MAKEYTYMNVDTSIIVIGIIIVLLVIFKIVKDIRTVSQNRLAEQIKAKEISACPDYWETVGQNKCRNIHKLGKCGHNNDVDFNDDMFVDKRTGNMMKCRYAKQCDISWEGASSLC